MIFSEYLHFLHKYYGADKTNPDFMVFITDLFIKEAESESENHEDENDKYNPLSGDIRKLQKIYSHEGGYKLSKRTASKLRSKFSSDKFIEESKQIRSMVKEDFISDLKSFGIKVNRNNCFEKAADVYYQFLVNLSDGVDSLECSTAEKINEKKENDLENGLAERNTSIKYDNYIVNNQQIVLTIANYGTKIRDEMVEAISFCKKHDKEIELLPLCLLADVCHPLSPHNRQMYDDFSLCKEEVKKQIFKLCGLDWIDFENDWLLECIKLLENDIYKYDLGTRSFLYDGAKYLHYALNFSTKKIDNIDPYDFESVVDKSDVPSSITVYMNEYLYHFNRHKAMYRPIDMVWDREDLFNCPLEEMTFWVMRMIISLIKTMPLGKYNQEIAIEESCIETYEDMYYYTLLVLYTRYFGVKSDSSGGA